jgi:metal-responsive CopG/Arc/MetJ family transcriptional regulator
MKRLPERFSLQLATETADRIGELLRPGESKSELIRAALETELDRRELRRDIAAGAADVPADLTRRGDR